MISNKIFKNIILAFAVSFLLSACATQKKMDSQMQGDVYTGTDTVEYLASGVPARVFFATNEAVLTTASTDTLRPQASCLRKHVTRKTSIQQVLPGERFSADVQVIFACIIMIRLNPIILQVNIKSITRETVDNLIIFSVSIKIWPCQYTFKTANWR